VTRRVAAFAAAVVAAIHAVPARAENDALAPAGPQAARIARLVWLYTGVSTAVLVLVLAALAVALLVRRRRAAALPDVIEVEVPPNEPGEAARAIAPPERAAERRRFLFVSVATGASVVVLIVLLFASVLVGRAVDAFGATPALELRVVGHQWWWEVQYLDPDVSRLAFTANELHVPVGKPVRIQLESRDVNHSFWVPSLHGKVDLIPGERNRIVIQTDRPGTYRGQCAEFCGPGHARMALLVVAEDEATFRAWLDRQRRPAPDPASDEARRGRELLVQGACAMCHTIRGTTAGASAGPDLTHVGGRLQLGAGTVPNVRGHLQGWIANSQSVKPGNNMPPMSLSPADLQALSAFLEGLE
jgi:cytochrome c oxidase subunit II